jgi:ethanolamine ammonia-lyase large subunit
MKSAREIPVYRQGWQRRPALPLARSRRVSEVPRLRRRGFIGAALLGVTTLALGCIGETTPAPAAPRGVFIPEILPGEDIFAYIERIKGGFDQTLYRQIVGAANERKEGDEAAGVAAADEASRKNARALLSNTRIADLRAHSLFEDGVYTLIEGAVDSSIAAGIAAFTMGELKAFLLEKPEDEIKAIQGGLSSDIIGCVVKLLSNDELIAVGSKVFNPLPGTNLGAKGYLGARIQPNSPTDDIDDIVWQVFNGWSFAVGDVVLGTNPVSSEIDSVTAVEAALKDILATFKLEDVMPHCVLSHIDIQAKVEEESPGLTALWFQSLGGTEGANHTFDLTIEKMLDHAKARTKKFGLYFETGQGADGTNGHGEGFDMVVHESRKYGFARALKQVVATAQHGAGAPAAPWVHLNDVAGFIGPEVFRTREQLVRCCLEDIVMGKLHGLMIGLDVCSTLHMDVTLDDLDWCLDQIMPANPGYLMALPTKNDPMLSYLTTAFQDHVRIRSKFGYKVDDAMWAFFKDLGVIDDSGAPTEHFGDPVWVYLKYRRAKGDVRSDNGIIAEGKERVSAIMKRGVFIAEGYGKNPWDLNPKLDKLVRDLYEDSKKCIWAELPQEFAAGLPAAVSITTQSIDRTDYVLHPPSGEQLDLKALEGLTSLAEQQAGKYDVQIMISDGLDALALTDEGHLGPFLAKLMEELPAAGYTVSPMHIVATRGRVRAGYRAGEILFGGLTEKSSHRALLHIIGERPGSGHHAYSVYITAPTVSTWANTGEVDHNITKVVSGIADTALDPATAALETVSILKAMAPS